MRLTCPNCGAQYEVPDEVIPEAGRDVQCSNCGDTWFQHHPDHPPSDEVDEPETGGHAGWESPSVDVDEDQETAGRFQKEEYTEEPEKDSDHEFENAIVSPPRRELDPSIVDVLREEAEREQIARTGEGNGLETQPDLGLDEQGDSGVQRSQQVASRMARLRGVPDEVGMASEQAKPDPDPGSRRNLLPDIDEINSSLNSENTRVDMGGETTDEAQSGMSTSVEKGGFRRGFVIAVLLFLVLTLLYLLAPMIEQQVPALASAMSSYVDAVNSARVWLSALLDGSN